MAALFGSAPAGDEVTDSQGFGVAEFGAGGGVTGAVPAASSSSMPSFEASAPKGDKPTFAEKETEFEDMVGDMRTTFISWLRRTEGQLQDAKGELLREKEEFEDEKSRVWKQFMAEKQKEYEKLQADKRKNEAEIA